MSIRSGKWILLGPVLALLLLSHGFTGNLKYGVRSWEVPSSQPAQMRSRVDYDPKLTDPFFKSNELGCPEGGGKKTTCRDGRPSQKLTARCFSTSSGSKHEVEFCEARSVDASTIELFINGGGPAFDDNLSIRIKNGMFMCQYWTEYKRARMYDNVLTQGDLIWTTKKQELTLDNHVYRKGDEIKGRIVFECVEEATHPKWIEEYGKNPITIKVYGVFKTIVE
jgi:hypothetical protein